MAHYGQQISWYNELIGRVLREFPDFGFWAFTCAPEDAKQQQRASELYYAMCTRLLRLLSGQLPQIETDEIGATSKAIGTPLFLPPSCLRNVTPSGNRLLQ